MQGQLEPTAKISYVLSIGTGRAQVTQNKKIKSGVGWLVRYPVLKLFFDLFSPQGSLVCNGHRSRTHVKIRTESSSAIGIQIRKVQIFVARKGEITRETRWDPPLDGEVQLDCHDPNILIKHGLIPTRNWLRNSNLAVKAAEILLG